MTEPEIDRSIEDEDTERACRIGQQVVEVMSDWLASREPSAENKKFFDRFDDHITLFEKRMIGEARQEGKIDFREEG